MADSSIPGTGRPVPALERLDEIPEKELLRRVHEDADLAAREELITRYLPLVRSLARRFASRGQAVEDLVQVGSIGLIKAVDRFDITRGVELSTYATPTVLGEIKRYFRDKGWAVKVPRALQDLNIRLNKVIEQLTVELNRSPTIQELAEHAGVTEEEVLEALESGRAYSSLSIYSSGSSDEDDSMELLDYLGKDESQYELVEQRRFLAPAMEKLDERERLILHLRFFEGMTQTQIAARVGISQMHVSRLIRKSIELLRQFMLNERELREIEDSEED
ncbi:MAG TPA: SigB/SigF/SigG family RNA polymerase sigma factor [Thermoleophilia bacterium]|nr:SigB/SigF/SigG family RNA polymerase sigma factor [Thermoleophilia bacterium]